MGNCSKQLNRLTLNVKHTYNCSYLHYARLLTWIQSPNNRGSGMAAIPISKKESAYIVTIREISWIAPAIASEILTKLIIYPLNESQLYAQLNPIPKPKPSKPSNCACTNYLLNYNYPISYKYNFQTFTTYTHDKSTEKRQF